MIERRPSTAGARDNESRWGDRIFEELRDRLAHAGLRRGGYSGARD